MGVHRTAILSTEGNARDTLHTVHIHTGHLRETQKGSKKKKKQPQNGPLNAEVSLHTREKSVKSSRFRIWKVKNRKGSSEI